MDSPISRYDIPNLRKACEVIKAIAECSDGLSFKQLQHKTSIPRTTLIRILETLQIQEFVRQRSNKFYQLGNEFLRIGLQFSNRLNLRELSASHLNRLAISTRATSHLAVPSGNKSLIVAVQESPERIQAASKPGFVADLHCSSTGKCFLAMSNVEVYKWCYENNPNAYTPKTMTDPSLLEAELAITRKRGYAIDNEEYSIGIRCCAAPVYNAAGQMTAAIGITAPANLFTSNDDERISRLVMLESQALSAALGFISN